MSRPRVGASRSSVDRSITVSRRSSSDPRHDGPDQERSSPSRRSSPATVSVIESVSEGCNVVVLRGRLSRTPEHRVLASGSVLLTVDVTIRPPGEQAETVPLVWFDPPDRALRLDAGDEVVVVGRVRRRFFRSGGATLSRTEVIASSITSTRATAQIRAAILAALDPITLPE